MAVTYIVMDSFRDEEGRSFKGMRFLDCQRQLEERHLNQQAQETLQYEFSSYLFS